MLHSQFQFKNKNVAYDCHFLEIVQNQKKKMIFVEAPFLFLTLIGMPTYKLFQA